MDGGGDLGVGGDDNISAVADSVSSRLARAGGAPIRVVPRTTCARTRMRFHKKIQFNRHFLLSRRLSAKI